MQIYKLYFATGEVYVGKTTNSINVRYGHHCSELKNGKHHSHKMQEVYNRNQELPTVEILEECNYSNLDKRERYWISFYNSFYKGLNCTEGGDGPAHGEGSPKALYSLDDYKAVVIFCAHTDWNLADISRELDVSYRVVFSIQNKQAHTYLKEILPIEYQMMVDRNTANKKVYPKLKDTLGNTYIVTNITKFAREFNVDRASLSRVLDGTATSCKGFYLESTKVPILAYEHQVESPDGTIYTIPANGVAAFATKHNLDRRQLASLINNKRASYKGWKKYES